MGSFHFLYTLTFSILFAPFVPNDLVLPFTKAHRGTNLGDQMNRGNAFSYH